MFNLKFKVNGQEVEATVTDVNEAASLLSSLSGAKKAVTPSKASKASARRKYRKTSATRSWQRWTTTEARALIQNKDKSVRELFILPELAGRSRNTLRQMKSYASNPETLAKAPAGFRAAVEEVMAGSTRSTGLLD